jgi:hypothetical protein
MTHRRDTQAAKKTSALSPLFEMLKLKR